LLESAERAPARAHFRARGVDPARLGGPIIGVASTPRGGPVAVVQDGDVIAIDVDEGTLVVELDDRELVGRLIGWQPPPSRYDVGVFARHRALVSSASNGAVLVPPA
jgi:dihydroxy-acid dehydratase